MASRHHAYTYCWFAASASVSILDRCASAIACTIIAALKQIILYIWEKIYELVDGRGWAYTQDWKARDSETRQCL